MSAEIEVPLRGDTWVHRSNSAVVVLVTGRSEGTVMVVSDSPFIGDGVQSFALPLFVRNFKLELRP
jgi:hypothetical protein